MSRGAARVRGLLAALLIGLLPATGLTMPLAARAAARAPATHPAGHGHAPGPHSGGGHRSVPGPHSGPTHCCDWCTGACAPCGGAAPEAGVAPPLGPGAAATLSTPPARSAAPLSSRRLPFPLGPPALRS